MNILPSNTQEFRDKEYWESFFKKRRQKAFEWYGSYGDLCSILHKYIKTTDNVLVVGCGNSKLSADMYQVGIRRVTNIDISEVVIKNMRKVHSATAPDMRWLRMDAAQMEFENDEFSAVLDKGTLDALMTDDTDTVMDNVDQMFKQIERVLKYGGRYICVSLLQEHILKKILNWYLERGWIVRVCRRPDDAEPDQSNQEETGIKFPVFVVVCTKLKPMGEAMKNTFLEVALSDEAPKKSSVDEVVQLVRDLQRVAFLQNKLSTSSVRGEDVSLQLFNENRDSPRYTLYVVDTQSKRPNKFAIFIVPNGRETEWLFGNLKGREKLADMVECQRLVVVHLNRNHVYDNLEIIKDELSKKVMNLAPKDYNPNMMVQFLSVGDDVGKRNVLHRCNSEINGQFVVEDVEGEEQQMYRRLIFLNASNAIQSDARLVTNKQKRRKKSNVVKEKLVVDVTFLACQHLYFMVAGYSYLPPEILEKKMPLRTLVIGLGGGSLPMFLYHAFSHGVVNVVELDPCIVDVAKEYFGFITDERMTVEVADGLKFINDCQDNLYDVLMLDVDNKDSSVGMSFPPNEFVERATLAAYERVLKTSGVLVLNLVCRDEQLKSEVISRVSSSFSRCLSRRVPGQVNEIVYGLKSSCEANITTLNKVIRSNIRNHATLSEFKEMIESFDDLNFMKSHDNKPENKS